MLVVGLAATAGGTVVSRLTYQHAEHHLTTLETQLTAAALSVAPIDVQRRLGAPLTLTAGSGDPNAFQQQVATAITPSGPFATVELFSGEASPKLLASVGQPALASAEERSAVLAQALKTPHELAITWLRASGKQRFGYAEAASGPGGTFVAYAEQELPANRHVTLPAGSPAAGLWFAIYFGRTHDDAALVETNASHLPLGGAAARAPVAFGNQTLTLAVAPRKSLEGPFAENLPGGIAVVGTLLTLLAAAMTERLTRRRLAAETLSVDLGRAYQAQRSVAETLQRSLLPQQVPKLRGVDIDVRYLPGMAGLQVGGDWYDVIALDERRLFFGVGDVVGRGLDAAVLMSTLRNATAAYVAEGCAPQDLLTKLSRLLAGAGDERFATMVCGVLDLASGVLTIANAGHPGLVLLTDEAADIVSATPGPPIGIGELYAATTITMHPGATLLAYTDGLIERRGESLDAGLARLREASASPHPLPELLDHVLQQMVPDGAHDDIAVLAIRFGGGALPVETPAEESGEELVLGAEPESVPAARRFATTALAGHQHDLVADAELVVTELVTNAALHGAPPIRLRVRSNPDGVRIEVHDAGHRMPVPARRNTAAMTGRGLSLVGAITGRWGVEPENGGKVVWAELSADRRADVGPALADLDVEALLASWPDEPDQPIYEIRLGAVPTDLLLAAKSHIDNVVREFTLMRGQLEAAGAGIPVPLQALIDSVTHDFADARADIKRQATGALRSGRQFTELVLHLPLSAADAGERYLAALDEADRYARAVRLLTPPPPTSHRAFRRWYVQSLVDQLRAVASGQPPSEPPPLAGVLAGEVDRLAALEDSAHRLALLQKVTGELTSAHSVQDVADTVVANATQHLRAESARLYVLTDRATLRSIAWHGRQGPAADVYDEFALDADLPGAEVARTGHPQFLRNTAQILQQFPDLRGYYHSEVSLWITPLRLRDQTGGLLALTFAGEDLGDEPQLAFVKALADAAAQALERARAIERNQAEVGD